ncbi:MAG: hypothetical protein BWX80_03378 [Candidatus Hydrogenedentes bacterium ADurb.Bin101]|nr:MAG: hypothetical protein BWX80_03378 [Candidatus Hydrogenedentes bacterium ADurb.Bin101]
MPVGIPSVHLRPVRPIREKDRLTIIVGHRFPDNARAAVEQPLDLGLVRKQFAFVVARDVKHINAAARFKNSVQVFAVIVGFQERMPLGEQHLVQGREHGIPEEQAPLGPARRQVQVLAGRRAAVRLRPETVPEFPVAADLHPLPFQTVNQLRVQRQHPVQRRLADQGAPIRLPAGTDGAVRPQRGQIILVGELAPPVPFAQKSILHQPVPILFRQALRGQAGYQVVLGQRIPACGRHAARHIPQRGNGLPVRAIH